jgi:DNA uptake protein ComE-like DNA-binding protein
MDDKFITNVSEFANQTYTYLSNKFQNSIFSEFTGIVLTLDINHWLVFLFLLTVAVVVFIYKKFSTKQLSDSACYIKFDNLYENHNHFMGLVLIASLVFVPYAYNVTGHEVKFLKYIELSMLGILICYLVWIPVYITRFFLVFKWKQETLKMFENSAFSIFDCHKSQVIKYTWKEKEAEKLYSAFIAKISSSQKILEKELEYYKKGLNKDILAGSHLDQSKTAIIHFDSKENSTKSEDKSIKSVAKTIKLEEQQVNTPNKWTIANHFYFWILTFIALIIAWKQGGWWWLFAFLFMGGVINTIEEKDKSKDADVTNKPINEDVNSKTPALSVLAEQKITKPSVPVSQDDSNNKTEPKSKESSPAFGIWTFIAFAIAFFAGGFWWVLAIGMGLAWLGKRNENKEGVKVQVATPIISTNIPSNNLSGWATQLTNICAQYNGNDYYVAELIPAQKLENAMKNYPIPNGGLVIALIDATVFGSAGNGMLIGEKGISWHNGFSTKSRFTSMKWAYFSAQNVSHDNTNIMIGAENLFNMSGCSFDKNKIIDLFKAIQQAYLLQETNQQLTQANDFSKYVSNQQKHGLVSTGTWIERLTKVCLGYSSDGFYVGELLPQDKLQYAMKEYPTPDNGKIVALIDTSAFGSIQGMAIGEHGVSWHNRSAYGYSSFRWKDFSEKVISQEGEHLKIGKGAIFNLIGDSQQNKTLVAFLKNIQHIYLERENEYKQPEDIIDQVLFQDSANQKDRKISRDIPHKSESVKVTDSLIDLNTADLDTLLGLPGIGVAEAKNIIKQRDVAGPFSSTKQVFDFLKLKPHHANQWKARVVIKESTSPQNLNLDTLPKPEIHRPLGGRTID